MHLIKLLVIIVSHDNSTGNVYFQIYCKLISVSQKGHLVGSQLENIDELVAVLLTAIKKLDRVINLKDSWLIIKFIAINYDVVPICEENCESLVYHT